MIVCGVIVSTSSVVIRSRTTLSVQADAERLWISSPTVRERRLPKCSYSSRSLTIGAARAPSLPREVLRVLRDADLDRARGLRTSATMSSVVRRSVLEDLDAQPLVELVAADLVRS